MLYADTVPKKVSLTEIVVKGKKPPVSFKIDRQVFDAKAYAAARQGTAVDLVRNLPSVSLNGQGELNVRGSSSFQVLVNGRPTQGEPSFVLSQIPAAQIDRVEIISSPGAAFDADGKSGVMNIITRTAPEQGLLLQSNLMGDLGIPGTNIRSGVRQTCRSPGRKVRGNWVEASTSRGTICQVTGREKS
jgi:outer membrane cobalamin receptor